MQLIYDSDTDADIRKINMAVINSENINEKFSSDRLLDKFSQNGCAEEKQEDVKKLNEAEVISKDIENSSNTEINKLNDSINKERETDRELQNQTVTKHNQEESKNIVTRQSDLNQELGPTSCNELVTSVLESELPSQISENVENESNKREILTRTMSDKTVLEINSNESKESLDCNIEDSATVKNISKEIMDVDEHDETVAVSSKIGIERSLLANNIGTDNDTENDIIKLNPILNVSNDHKETSQSKINLEKINIDNTRPPSPNKLNDVVNTNIVISIEENTDLKLTTSTNDKVLKNEITLPEIGKKSISAEDTNEIIDSNTIEINDDSSQDDLSQKATSVNAIIELSPTKENVRVNKPQVNDIASPSQNSIEDDISKHSTELNNLTDKNSMTNEPKVDEDKSMDCKARNASTIEQKDIEQSVKSKLPNILNILSDDDEDVSQHNLEETKPCVNEDDEILLIDDEDTNGGKKVPANDLTTEKDVEEILENKANAEENLETQTNNAMVIEDIDVKNDAKITAESDTEKVKIDAEKPSPPSFKPLLPSNFLTMCKKNVSEFTRNDLEEFCIMKIVESVVDRGNIGELKSQLKKMAVSLDEHRNKIKSITKQNQDLQVILRSVQESCRKNSLVTPLKITRSVGIQVLMDEKYKQKATNTHQNNTPAKPARSSTLQNKSKQVTSPQNIPVPRLVPAKSSPSNVTPNQTPNNKVPNQQNTPIRPAAPRTEKRSFSKSQTGSDTVDLTDDEPPNKVITRPGNQNVRVISPQNLMPPQHRVQLGNSPRKVYIPIAGGQVTNIRPTPQSYMLKPANNLNARQRALAMRRMHPAPLPESTKQYQAPSWKAIPPAPEIKLTKVDNGIVISWKLDNYRDDIHENIASYQIYAYQETPSPPNTNLWKKIGDVKALPLPMACTLTQFVPGFKYYFAVRAVDVRSRQGSFSSPGNIMLLNK